MAGARAVEIGSAVYDDVKVFETIKESLYAKDGIACRRDRGVRPWLKESRSRSRSRRIKKETRQYPDVFL